MPLDLTQNIQASDITTYRKTFDLQNDSSQTLRTRNLKGLTLRVSILCLSTFYFGYCLVYLSTLSQSTMIRQFSDESQEVVVHGIMFAFLTIGGAVGSFVSPFLMKRNTRRNLFTILNCGALAVEVLIQYPSLYCLVMCRGLQGFFMGHFMTLIPAYISQLSPKQVVGRFKVFNQLFFVLGILFAYSFGAILTKSGVSDHITWRLIFGLNIVVNLFMLLSCLCGFIPQSPKSFIRKGMKQETKQVLGLFVKKQFIQQVFTEKLIEVNNELKNIINPRFKLPQYSRKAYFIGFLLPVMQPWTGINAIMTSIGHTLEAHSFSFGYYVPIVISFVLLASIFGSIYASKTFGKRTILLTGTLGLGICDLMIAVSFLYAREFSFTFWIIFGILIIYMVIYGTTIGPTVWMYIPEIIPGKLVPVAATINFVSSSACLSLSPIIKENEGISAVYFVFGGITLIITIINMFGMIESKGLDGQQIRKAYLGKQIK